MARVPPKTHCLAPQDTCGSSLCKACSMPAESNACPKLAGLHAGTWRGHPRAAECSRSLAQPRCHAGGRRCCSRGRRRRLCRLASCWHGGGWRRRCGTCWCTLFRLNCACCRHRGLWRAAHTHPLALTAHRRCRGGRRLRVQHRGHIRLVEGQGLPVVQPHSRVLRVNKLRDHASLALVSARCEETRDLHALIDFQCLRLRRL